MGAFKSLAILCFLKWVLGIHESYQYNCFVAQLLNHVQLFATPWTAAHQASLSFTISWRLLKLMSVKSVMLSNDLILCCPLLLQPSIFPSIRFFSNESAPRIRQPNIGASASVLPMNTQDRFPLVLTGLILLVFSKLKVYVIHTVLYI